MNFIVTTFSQLTNQQLYDLLQLRSEIFVVEQDCVYQDLDGKDQEAIHVLGYKNKKLVAYTRLFDAGYYFKESSIGRVVVKENERTHGYGHEVMKKSIEVIKDKFNTSSILISAQKYLVKFYNSHGFTQVGDEYLEDGIPHVKMERS